MANYFFYGPPTDPKSHLYFDVKDSFPTKNLLNHYFECLRDLQTTQTPVKAIVNLANVKGMNPFLLYHLVNTMNNTRSFAAGKVAHAVLICPPHFRSLANVFFKMHNPVCPVTVI